MKLAPLLAQYLYTNKKLDLPGIGTFRLDPSSTVQAESGKQEKSIDPSAISFESNTGLRETPELVQFIAAHTGKFKALASADLQSHLELILQFLNIGKPFLLDGIGSLVKIRSGEFAFTSGQALPESMKDYSAREISSTSSVEETFTDYRKVINKPDGRMAWKRPAALLLIIAGIGLAVWGGYTVYRMSLQKNNSSENNELAGMAATDTNMIAENDSTAGNSNIIPAVHKDSVTKSPSSIANPVSQGSMKYILEEAKATRAFARFARLKTFFWPVKMETRDSVSYTLFMVLPSTYSDTTRIIDSLTNLNGRKVYVSRNP